MKNTKSKLPKSKTKSTPCEARTGGEPELYQAPPPPSKGSIIAIDCHPDIFTVAVVKGTTPHDAQHLETRGDISLEELLKWAAESFTKADIFLMEAGSNSFEIHRKLIDLGLRALVLESTYIGQQAKRYADNDKLAAMRIAKVYLAGDAPCVWVPDEQSTTRRELLHSYQRAVEACTESTNAIKGYLNQKTIRLKKRSIHSEATRRWIAKQYGWDPLQKLLLEDHYQQIDVAAARRKKLHRCIAAQVAGESQMLGLMSLLGIGLINAFALVAVIGDVSRFESPRKLVAYLGLNPGQKDSGKGKRKKVGVGRRGRKDLRSLLIQGAQAVMRKANQSPLNKWGWKLFARKGKRNIAVTAVARKLATQVWHLLKGNKPEQIEPSKSRETKLKKMLVLLGTAMRKKMNLPGSLKECIEHFDTYIIKNSNFLQKNA